MNDYDFSFFNNNTSSKETNDYIERNNAKWLILTVISGNVFNPTIRNIKIQKWQTEPINSGTKIFIYDNKGNIIKSMVFRSIITDIPLTLYYRDKTFMTEEEFKMMDG